MSQKVLMCRPIHFRVDYRINPWMEIGSVDQEKAQKQWTKLVEQYKSLGLEVEIIDQDERYPDMVFATDQGVVFDKDTILLSRFRYEERRGESELYAKWYEDNGYSLKRLPEGVYFEGGGEMQEWRDKILVGTGFRTDKKTAAIVGNILNKEVVILELIDERFYHLDTCLTVLNDEVVFYYPEAFSQEARSTLKDLVPELIEYKESDVMGFAANSMVVDSTVVMQTGNKRLAELVKKYGFKTKEVDLGEFIKAGGGARCLTGDLDGI